MIAPQSRNVDLVLLRLFCALWDTRSVTRAAAIMEMPQSSASAALGRLRVAFGDRLFLWDGHVMLPTARAVESIAEVRHLLSSANSLLHRDAPQPAQYKRHFVIASADYLTALYGGPLVDLCAREAPGIVCEFIDVKPEMLNKGYSGTIDFFLMPSGRLQTAGFKSQLLYCDKYVCVGRTDNEELTRSVEDPERFLALRHIGYSAVQRAVSSHETNNGPNGSVPSYRLLSAHYLAFAIIAARSDAVAILPRRAADIMGGRFDLQVIPPPISLPDIAVTLYWQASAEQDAAASWLRQAMLNIELQ